MIIKKQGKIKLYVYLMGHTAWHAVIILCMRAANERWRYIVM